MTFFNNTTVSVLRLELEDSYDDYGELNGEYTTVAEYPCDLQGISPAESMKEYGEILKDTYKIYLQDDADIRPTDRLKIDDTIYSIIGTPTPSNHLLPVSHLKLNIKKERGG